MLRGGVYGYYGLRTVPTDLAIGFLFKKAVKLIPRLTLKFLRTYWGSKRMAPQVGTSDLTLENVRIVGNI